MKRRPDFKVRFELTSLGKRRFPKLRRQTGVIIGAGRNPGSVRVIFDGCKTASTIHRSYLTTTPGCDEPSDAAVDDGAMAASIPQLLNRAREPKLVAPTSTSAVDARRSNYVCND